MIIIIKNNYCYYKSIQNIHQVEFLNNYNEHSYILRW